MEGRKITSGIRQLTTTHSEMAKALGVSRQRVTQLVQEQVLVCDDSGALLLVANIQNYERYKASGGQDGEELDYMQERARHEKVKREIAELKLAKMERNAYSAKTVELAMTEMLSNLRTQLLGLPSKLAPQLEGKSKEDIYVSMEREIKEKLSELSEYTPELFSEEIEEGGDEDSD